MRDVADYRRDMLTILGDAGGRRYAEGMLDMGLREALAAYVCKHCRSMSVMR